MMRFFQMTGLTSRNKENGENKSSAKGSRNQEQPKNKYTWVIKEFSQKKEKKLYSDVFQIGPYRWRVLVFPRGNETEHLSIYLDAIVTTQQELEEELAKQNNTKKEEKEGTPEEVNGNDEEVDEKNGSKKDENSNGTTPAGVKTLQTSSSANSNGSNTETNGTTPAEPIIIPEGDGWSRITRFSITIKNQNNEKESERKEATHKFYEKESDWGFKKCIELNKLTSKSGFLKNDTLILEVEIESIQSGTSDMKPFIANVNTRKTTGFVGLRNQGATCYLNSLLQSLYHLGYFRKAVYQLPTESDNDPNKSIPLALQRLFYMLQFSETSVSTKELTKSFGWTAFDSFIQHDIQELNRVLSDNLEEKMKGTKAEGAIQKLLTGKILNYVKCINIDYTSTRLESFYDLSLNVKGCKDIMESLDKYVEVEKLVGENKYHANEHGLQDAKKGCWFHSFPPVLHIQLKRFEYDPNKDDMAKVNDKYSFPLVLKLNQYLAPEADRSIDYVYHLHGVLVHSGNVHGGHYYSFIRPTTKPNWYNFDDERVTIVDEKEAVEDNFGGEEEHSFSWHGVKKTSVHKKTSNAYMLVYIRASSLEEVLHPTDEDDIPQHLKERFQQEKQLEEVKQKEQAEAHLFINVKVALFQDFQNHPSTKFDLMDFSQARLFRVKKSMSLKEFKQVAREAFSIPVNRQRYWNWSGRHNKTFRPDLPISPRDEDRPLGEIAKGQDFKVYLEVSSAPMDVDDNEYKYFNPHLEDDILLFFKYYNPADESLRFVGHTVAKLNFKLPDLIPVMNGMMGFPSNELLLVYEEVKPQMIDPLKPTITMKEAELGNGDILVFQKALPSDHHYQLPTAPSYYDYILNRINVQFRKLEKPKEAGVVLDLSKKMNYDQITAKLGKTLGIDGAKIRLTGHSNLHDQPRTSPIKRSEKLTLGEMLSVNSYHQQMADILYYETLEITVEELESKREMKITWLNSKAEATRVHVLLMPFESTVEEVCKELAKLEQISLSADPIPALASSAASTPSGSTNSVVSPTSTTKPVVPVRLIEVWNCRIHKIFNHSEPISGIGNFAALFAEEISEEELKMDKLSRRVQIVNFSRETVIHTFGNPFFLVVKKNETVKETKRRIRDRLEVSKDEFSKWKVAVISASKVEYLKDSECIFNRELSSGEYIGLEHTDTTMRSPATHFRRPEKAITIKG